jgi:tRNA (guanine37-N1)-methyltransferase
LLALHGVESARLRHRCGYRRVDERPFGGGPGMVMLIEPAARCLNAARAADADPAKTIYLSPQGAAGSGQGGANWRTGSGSSCCAGATKAWTSGSCRHEVDEELSIGDYVLSGGELAAAVVIDAVGRLQDGASERCGVGHRQDSFEGDGLLDCPHYTQPSSHPAGRRAGGAAAPATMRRSRAGGGSRR